MEKSEKQLMDEAEKLYQEKKHLEIINLLSDTLLKNLSSSILYCHKARAWYNEKDDDKCLNYLQQALIINPDKAWAYLLRGLVFYRQKEYSQSILEYGMAIKHEEDYSSAYNNRGNAYRDQNKLDEAINDYNKGIKLKNEDPDLYNNRGNAFFLKKDYDQAIADYNQTLSIDKQYALAYRNRGLALFEKKNYIEAIADYTKAIELNIEHKYIYFNRARAYTENGNYENAINDYRTFISLLEVSDSYNRERAEDAIKELEQKIANKYYDEIDDLIKSIKDLLLFKKECITHYTSFVAAKAMIFEDSLFRISAGSFLNDTSEGQELFKYLNFRLAKEENGDVEIPFIEKPFIGSFVADDKYNDLSLWRLYGKDTQVEAKGCALTINRQKFIDNLQLKLQPDNTEIKNVPQTNNDLTFYQVAYHDRKGNFILPEAPDKKEELERCLSKLKDKVKELDANQRTRIAHLLNGIAYLFKNTEYQYEHEVRLVVNGVGLKKTMEHMPPKVFIELIELVPILSKVTLGPKIERAEEWASVLNYRIKEKNDNVEIIISRLPFK